jgi:hypothetical protein
MAKVEGSNPFIRLQQNACKRAFWVFDSSFQSSTDSRLRGAIRFADRRCHLRRSWQRAAENLAICEKLLPKPGVDVT